VPRPVDLAGAVIPEEPMRAVRSSECLPRPGGGFVQLVTLECGHSVWCLRRREPTRPPRARRCVSCWLVAMGK